MTHWPLTRVALVRDEKDGRFLPHPIRRQSGLTVKKGDKEEICDKRSQILCRKKNCNNPPCNFWYLPVCQNYKSGQCHFRHVQAEETKKLKREVVQKDQLRF